MTKHVYGVYSTTPPSDAPRPDQSGVQAALAARHRVPITDTYTGEASIVTYTVLHAREGQPDWGLVVCDLADGSRCYGRVGEPGMLDELEQDECVGRRVQLTTNDSNVNEVTAWAS
jgi:acetyl-CoA C-acetyltransferase